MKRAKVKNGTAETALPSNDPDRVTRRKSVAVSAARSNGNSSLGETSSNAKARNNGISNVNKRKSCPVPMRPGGNGSNLAIFLTPERVASVFEQDGEMTEAERSQNIRRIIMCFANILKPGPNQNNGISQSAFGNILKTLATHVDFINEENWSIVFQALQYAVTPSNSGANFINLEALINEILVHKPNYSSEILTLLISRLVRFTGPVTNAPSFDDDGPSISEMKSFDVAVKLICRIVQVRGMKSLNRSLINMLTASYPYVLKPPLSHFYYIRNLLAINKAVGNSMSYCVLSVIFHKLTHLDAMIPREAMESEELENLVLPKQEKTLINPNPSETFIIPEEDCEDLILEIVKSYGRVAFQVEQAQQIATMDICLSYLISFLHSAHENLNFPTLISIFENEVLPTFNTKCVQFAYFYLVNLKEEYLNAFMDALWKKFVTLSTPLVLRIQLMGYMAGVLARSTKADRRILKRWISRLSTFAHEYLSNRSGGPAHWSHVNIHAHGSFYAACQAIFYTFAFRHFEIVYGNVPHLKDEGKRGKKPSVGSLPPPSSTSFIYTLNLQRLITSDLNPLKACNPSVAKVFVEAAHAYQISYCKTVLERNNRATIRNMMCDNMQEVSKSAETAGVNILNDSFFPFDPLPLAYAKQLVDNEFRVYDSNSIALTLVGESTIASTVSKRRRGESECRDVCDDLDMDVSDVTDGHDILLVDD